MRSPAPAYAVDLNDATIDAARAALGDTLLDARARVGEVQLFVARDTLVATLTALRDTPGLAYQQLMEIAGVDYPERRERFDVVYCLLSLTRNHRVQVHVSTDEDTPIPSVTGLWPVAGWLEREVYDLFGVLFEGNADLRRILTDYGFRGHPLRKDFPQTGYTELRYSEEEKRVVYQPVQLAQDWRTFDFLSPWEGGEYTLPGDEKAALPEAKGAQTPLTADQVQKADAAKSATQTPAGNSSSYAAGAPGDTGKTGAGDADAGNKAGRSRSIRMWCRAREGRTSEPLSLPPHVPTFVHPERSRRAWPERGHSVLRLRSGRTDVWESSSWLISTSTMPPPSRQLPRRPTSIPTSPNCSTSRRRARKRSATSRSRITRSTSGRSIPPRMACCGWSWSWTARSSSGSIRMSGCFIVVPRS